MAETMLLGGVVTTAALAIIKTLTFCVIASAQEASELMFRLQSYKITEHGQTINC